MSKHHHHNECCNPMMGYGMTGLGMGGYGGGFGGAGYGGGVGVSGGGGQGIRWIYALLILIVVVLQFGKRKECRNLPVSTSCDGEVVSGTGCGAFGDSCSGGVIDNSVLFIIVVFLLVLCAGCWWGGSGAGAGAGGGYGSF